MKATKTQKEKTKEHKEEKEDTTQKEEKAKRTEHEYFYDQKTLRTDEKGLVADNFFMSLTLST
jgi:hypothetical protein